MISKLWQQPTGHITLQDILLFSRKFYARGNSNSYCTKYCIL